MHLGLEEAEMIGIKALAWLAGNEELLPVFLGATGLNSQDMREIASQPNFLGAVLDFLLLDDEYILSFTENEEVKPDDIYLARQLLPGGESSNWVEGEINA